jgi:hypothetical protein
LQLFGRATRSPFDRDGRSKKATGKNAESVSKVDEHCRARIGLSGLERPQVARLEAGLLG